MKMKIAAPNSEVTLSVFFFIIIIFSAIAADKDAVYMSKLMKSLSPTPPGWSNGTHFCKWKGILCNNQTDIDSFNNNRVISITLPSSSLTGTIPSDLNTLFFLTDIDLHNNSLTGPMPFFPESTSLQTILLGHNNFNSTPHNCFYGLVVLKNLNLSHNMNLIPWLFPSELSSSQFLHTLDLEATNMISSLPPDVFDGFPNLETLVLSHNNFTGSLPESLGRSAVKYLKLNDQGNNGFRGSIQVISTMKNLSQAWLNNNAFSNIIPDLSNCTHLFDLQLHTNELYGIVPHSLMSLSSLKNISLDNNQFQGPEPVFQKGVSATWENNLFCVGTCDPTTTALLAIFEAFEYPNLIRWNEKPCHSVAIGSCSINGEVLSFSSEGSNINGTISPAFANLTQLVNLTLSNNNLKGSIPDSLTTLSHLKLLDVSNNNLSGQIPKFSSKVKLNTTGNVLLGHGIGDGVGGGLSKTKNGSLLKPIWIAGVSLLFSVVVAILILIICKRKKYIGLIQKIIFKKKRASLDDNVQKFIKAYKLSMPKQYSYAEVKRITNSFKDKLGQGGYGVVYKASLPDGRQVAVKLINESKGDGEEFINEVASISRTSHVNIVSLLGFCYEKNKRALIYEFVVNGSLDKFIYRSGFLSAISNLDWNTLYRIAIGIARGLEYLHQGCTSRILHLDIKPQNILLDEDFCPKIADFGLAKICQKKDSIVSIQGMRGTIGFIAPEVFSRTYGGVSHKSDVYSYGMLILEMVGGRKNYDTGGSHTSEMYFPDWIYKGLELSDSLENDLATSKEEKDMIRKITMVSLWCIQTNPLDRPSMSKVIEMLQDPLQSVPYPPRPVLYSPQRAPLQSLQMSSSNLLETSSMIIQEDVP